MAEMVKEQTGEDMETEIQGGKMLERFEQKSLKVD